MLLFVVFVDINKNPYELAYYLNLRTALAYAEKLQNSNPLKKYYVDIKTIGVP